MMNKIFIICTVAALCAVHAVHAAPNKLSGRILLQVQQHGEAWYVNPENGKRYFLGRPADAFALMRELGLGISENNYEKFKSAGYKTPAALVGKILLRVESKGEAYYINPSDLKMHYLGRPADAFKVMRELGLGITDSDLGKITIEKGIEDNSASGQETASVQTENIKEEAVPVRQTRTYTGSGTYDFGEGDVLIDNVNNMKFVQSGLYEEYGQQWLLFSVYDQTTGQKIDNSIQLYLEPERLYTGYDPNRLIYYFYFEPAKIPLYYFTFKGKNPDGTYKVSFDFYLDDVLGDRAAGHKKILVVPAYFDDEYEVYDQFPLYRDTFLKPALEEIRAYLKTKQMEFMGQEIMTEDFTIADAIKLGKLADYAPDDKTDNYETRKALVKSHTAYDPDDFDLIAFLFFTEQYPDKADRNTARFDQAMVTSHRSPITDYELERPIQIHQIRSYITLGLLHEILHVYGMSDYYAWDIDAYEGKFYDGTQKLEDKRGDDTSTDSEWGMFQKINDKVASEIGWCDENNNGIFDANEFYVNKEE